MKKTKKLALKCTFNDLYIEFVKRVLLSAHPLIQHMQRMFALLEAKRSYKHGVRQANGDTRQLFGTYGRSSLTKLGFTVALINNKFHFLLLLLLVPLKGRGVWFG